MPKTRKRPPNGGRFHIFSGYILAVPREGTQVRGVRDLLHDPEEPSLQAWSGEAACQKTVAASNRLSIFLADFSGSTLSPREGSNREGEPDVGAAGAPKADLLKGR
jgi:hypothetical protein